jgi:hypothetical protein
LSLFPFPDILLLLLPPVPTFLSVSDTSNKDIVVDDTWFSFSIDEILIFNHLYQDKAVYWLPQY